jgi:zinc protease
VGDVQPQKALAEVKKYSANIPSKKIPERPEILLESVKSEMIKLKSDLSYGLLMISFILPGYDSKDYPAIQVLADVLSSQRIRPGRPASCR